MSRVLVVHAQPVVAHERAAAIRRAGHDTVAVTSGERAMDAFIQEPADVIVVDYQLEGRDGLATAEAIRWMPGGRRARLLLTAASEPEGASLEELGRGVEAFRAIVAPDPEALARVVDEAAAARPHEAETRVLEVEQALLAAERAQRAWDETTTAPDGGAAMTLDDETFDEPDRDDWEWRDTDGRAEGREVRAIAESAHTESDLVGSFEVIPFPRLLHRMAERRASGALICVHPPDERATTEGTEPTKIVYFRAGVPVAVRSNLVEECLGQVLARTRKIGPATLRESLSAVQRGEGRQGEVPVEMGALAPLELSEALADQLRIKLFELFAWRRGTFRFAADRPPPRELIDLGLGLAEIAFSGIREGMPAARVLERLMPDRERFVIPRPRELVRFVRLHVPEPLGAVIRAIDGTRRLRELLESSGDPAGAAQLVYAMACLSAVRFADAPVLPHALVPSSEEWEGTTPLEDGDDERWAAAPSAADADRATRVLRAEDAPLDAPSVPVLPPTSVERPAPKSSEDERLPSDVPPASEPAREPEGSQPHVLDERVERLLTAERHFRRGQRALDRDKAQEAVAAFARASELCPEEGQFLAYLGWAKHASSPDDAFALSEAVDLAERACRLAPDLAVAHLLRARLLGAVGRADGARAAFARVLELDPENAEARAAT